MRVVDVMALLVEHGVLLESARGPIPNVAELVAGEPITGSWWGHPSSHAIFRVPPNAFCTAASNTRTLARQMSAPVPSPSMKGMIGSSGTTSALFLRAIAVPLVGGLSVVKFGIFLGQVTCDTRKISANTVENSVENASRLRCRDVQFRVF